MKIKVCGMTDPGNLKSVLDCKPDFVGFIFYSESSRYVNKDNILFMPTEGVQKVGVFVNEETDILLALASIYHMDLVQLHGDESPDYCQELTMNNLNIIKVFSINKNFEFKDLKSYIPFVDYFLFDTKGEKRGGNGTKFNWSILNNYKLEIPFFLSGGITENDVTEIQKLTHSQLFGVDINSGFEISPGIKDEQSVNRFSKKLNPVITREFR